MPAEIVAIEGKAGRSDEDKKKFDEVNRKIAALGNAGAGGGGGRGGGNALPAYWIVEVDRGREKEPSYILSSNLLSIMPLCNAAIASLVC